MQCAEGELPDGVESLESFACATRHYTCNTYLWSVGLAFNSTQGEVMAAVNPMKRRFVFLHAQASRPRLLCFRWRRCARAWRSTMRATAA